MSVADRAYEYAWEQFRALSRWQRFRLYAAKSQIEWMDERAWEYLLAHIEERERDGA